MRSCLCAYIRIACTAHSIPLISNRVRELEGCMVAGAARTAQACASAPVNYIWVWGVEDCRVQPWEKLALLPL